MLIDYLRMFNDPMNAAWRWEKSFKRVYVLLKDYPLEYFDKQIQIDKPSNEFLEYFNKLKNGFMGTKEVQQSCLISGFDAYNFYVKHAAKDRNVEQMARTTYGKKNLNNLICNVPFMEFVSVDYRDTVERLYNFIRGIVPDAKKVTIDEYFPLFQFTGHSVFINYDGQPIARVFEADGMCIPNVKTTKGYMYVSYQYLLMTMLVNKFRSHLDKNRSMYFNYGIALSNLVEVRNIYLTENNLGVINSSVFGEFKISCVGSTVSYMRMGILRKFNRVKQGKAPQFVYEPERFFNQSEESQAKFDPLKHFFRNTSGNKISNPKNLIFRLDQEGNIVAESEVEEAYSDTEADAKEAGKDSDKESDRDITN